MKCRYCGCTDDRACPGGCKWVKDDVCSSCVTTARGLSRFVKAHLSDPMVEGVELVIHGLVDKDKVEEQRILIIP